ncbi:RloB family protein [Nocardiopsis sp. LOL_012]|uniref:RloB family protein n=1 Tax=Nocardiopsis sp. LOL_012 TaxID=3345409 RepID=UPI003A85AAE8
MREELRFSNVSIRLGDQHGEPYGLVLDAKKRKESAHGRRREQGGEFDEVWCVIDIEAPRPHDSLDEAMRLAHRSGIELAYANPCFELWLFLHQRDHSGYLTTESAIAKMRGLGCCYTSGKGFDPQHFLGRPQQEAIRRAELLDKRHEGKGHPRDRNPWTNIHILVRGLLEQG